MPKSLPVAWEIFIRQTQQPTKFEYCWSRNYWKKNGKWRYLLAYLRYQGRSLGTRGRSLFVVFCITINSVLAWQVSLQIWTHWCHNEWHVVCPYKYINHIAGECENRFVSQLRNYVEYKVNKSCFGDILPCVLTRALGTDLLILNKASSGYFCNFISKSEDSVCTHPLLILVRNDEYYDAIVERNVEKRDTFSTPIENTHLSQKYTPSDLVTDKILVEYRIKFIVWNVNGLGQDKLHDVMLGFLLKNYDIILLTETWGIKRTKTMCLVATCILITLENTDILPQNVILEEHVFSYSWPCWNNE